MTINNVFVLSTGRCGSLTFARACEHFTNYTSGHETLAVGVIGAARFDYPERHIESDKRLTWFLGQLAARFDDETTFYVHLQRDPEAVARSYLRRWNSTHRSGIARVYGRELLMCARPESFRSREWPEDQRLEVCRSYVETANSTIRLFLQGRTWMPVMLENVGEDFPRFIDRIGAEGNLEAAIAEWAVKHNASDTTGTAEEAPIGNE